MPPLHHRRHGLPGPSRRVVALHGAEGLGAVPTASDVKVPLEDARRGCCRPLRHGRDAAPEPGAGVKRLHGAEVLLAAPAAAHVQLTVQQRRDGGGPVLEHLPHFLPPAGRGVEPLHGVQAALSVAAPADVQGLGCQAAKPCQRVLHRRGAASARRSQGSRGHWTSTSCSHEHQLPRHEHVREARLPSAGMRVPRRGEVAPVDPHVDGL
mmetsp:Transcript_78873/g.218183  ORF Transcript_78873/g.218183 Transcript_78873/m.218183 type:complete len:209 (+) Transcript_78873:538-1164(+)